MKSVLVLAGLASALSFSATSFAEDRVPRKPTTVVLVHGAWADGSSWEKVIPLLQDKGLNVVAVQNPLTNLADDVAATQHAIQEAPGAVVLVGHSYGGSVISQAGSDEKVKALVFVAALAPSEGQSSGEVGADLAPAEGVKDLQPNSFGLIRLDQEAFVKNFAGDLPEKMAKVLAATQGPTSVKVFSDKLDAAAWKQKPDYYIVASKDMMIQPETERRLAKMMNAKTTEISSSHAVLLSHPAKVAKVILDAVANAK